MQFEIKDRKIRCVSSNLVGDNMDYIASFTFDQEWDGAVKTARFMKGSAHVDMLLENNSCKIPMEVLKGGYIRVGVFSSAMATTFCLVHVAESVKERDGGPKDPTPDVYTQIIQMLEEISGNGVTDAQIEKAVSEYLAENPVSGVDEADVQRIVEEYLEAHRSELKGDKGDAGADGKDGYTPVKGVDYFTDADKAELVAEVINVLPKAESEVY